MTFRERTPARLRPARLDIPGEGSSLGIGMEEAVTRYLGVFLPFIATIICGHYLMRSTGSPLLAGMELASPRLLRRALWATAVAVGLIVLVDGLTDGELFLRPRSPGTQLLITMLLVGVLLLAALGRSLAPLARWFKRAA